MKHNKTKLRDKVTSEMLKSAIGIFICLFAIMGMVNYTSFAQFFTYIIAFFVGIILTYLFYIALFLYGLKLVFNRRKFKIDLGFATIGIIFLIFGIMIAQTAGAFNKGLNDYVTFNGYSINSSVKGTYDFMTAFKASYSNFPGINYSNFSQHVGVLGLILTCTLNTCLTMIGSLVIASLLIVAGLVLLITKPLIKFTHYLNEYRKILKKRESDLKFTTAKQDDLDIKSITANIGDEPKEKISESATIEDSTLFEQKEIPVKEKEETKPVFIVSSNQLNDGIMKKAVFKDSGFGNEIDKKDEIEVIKPIEPIINDEKVEEKIEEDEIKANEIDVPVEPVEKMTDSANISINKPIFNTITHVQSEVVAEEDNEDNEENDDQIIEDNQNDIKVVEHFATDSNLIKKDIIAPDIDSIPSRHEEDIVKPEDVQKDEDDEEEIDENAPKIEKVKKPINYELAPSSLLDERDEKSNVEENKRVAEERVKIIDGLCNDFSFKAHITGYTIGPSVTRFDLQTDNDEMVGGFDKYLDDLSNRFSGVKARFEKVVTGKTTAGIEVANAKGNLVNFKDVFEHLPPLKKDKYMGMFIPFGKDIGGNYVYADFRELVHILLAGTTGSGKSVYLHTILLSLIMRNTPEEMKLLIIDPKRVEFTKYRDIPHLLCPIICDPNDAYSAFLKLADEMQRRYRMFEETETSSIKEYNKDYAPDHHLPKLPYIVVLVDEYSALVENNKAIGNAVLSIGQLARACGIHMIIATQAPRSTIITGSIKANLPTKIALLTGSSVDSVNILGTGGSEKLLGNGDMLISTPVISTTGLTRVQGAFVDNKEIKRVAGFYKTRYTTDYDPVFLTLHEESKQEVYDGNVNTLDKANDDKYEMVKEFAMSMDYCSISKITRSFGFGFNRAGKIFDQLKAEGILDNDPNGSSAKGTRVLKRSNPSGPSENTGSFEQTAVDYSKKGD